MYSKVGMKLILENLPDTTLIVPFSLTFTLLSEK